MYHQARADELARVPLFARCSKRELRRLASEAHVEQIDPGEKLVSQGSPSRHLYVILAGTAGIERDGAEVARVTKGGIVGELGLLFDEPATPMSSPRPRSRCSASIGPACNGHSTQCPAWAGRC